MTKEKRIKCQALDLCLQVLLHALVLLNTGKKHSGIKAVLYQNKSCFLLKNREIWLLMLNGFIQVPKMWVNHAKMLTTLLCQEPGKLCKPTLLQQQSTVLQWQGKYFAMRGSKEMSQKKCNAAGQCQTDLNQKLLHGTSTILPFTLEMCSDMNGDA